MQITDGQLTNAEWCPSPNFDARPEPGDISLLVVHNISLPPGQFGTGCVQDFFCNRLDSEVDPFFATIAELRVSAHLLIERDGRLVQFVNFNDRAWHAGQSLYDGRKRCNDFSIGIELEGTDDQPYTPVQYQQLAEVTKALLAAYPQMSQERITGHQHIAPGRKTDPGEAFDWAYFKGLVQK